jgi:hypothetical protein
MHMWWSGLWLFIDQLVFGLSFAASDLLQL